MTEAGITNLRCAEVSVNDNNNPSSENVMQYDYALPTPSSINFGFHDVNPWNQSGNFLVGRDNLKMTPNPRIQHMSFLDLFIKLYFMYYITYSLRNITKVSYLVQ